MRLVNEWEAQIPDLRQPHKIRYTPAEWALIVVQAQATGRPPARYIREASLGAAPKARRNRENDEMIRELGRIGTALTHLARLAKESGRIPEQSGIETTLHELLASVRRLG
jgi:hypothetical protein